MALDTIHPSKGPGFQPTDADLTAIAALTTTTFGRSTLESADATAFRTLTGTNSGSNISTGTVAAARLSSTMTAAQAFRQGNILAAVSQTSGVPTGGLLEYGTGANGDYLKFADGTMICSITVAARSLTYSATGSIAFAPQQTWTFPATFIAAPVIGGLSTGNGWISSTAATTTAMTYFPYASATGSLSVGNTLMAIGRWF